jgi:hypothetical protein
MQLTISSVDYATEELYEQMPIVAELPVSEGVSITKDEGKAKLATVCPPRRSSGG